MKFYRPSRITSERWGDRGTFAWKSLGKPTEHVRFFRGIINALGLTLFLAGMLALFFLMFVECAR